MQGMQADNVDVAREVRFKRSLLWRFDGCLPGYDGTNFGGRAISRYDLVDEFGFD